jgi:hypothetical protein
MKGLIDFCIVQQYMFGSHRLSTGGLYVIKQNVIRALNVQTGLVLL